MWKLMFDPASWLPFLEGCARDYGDLVYFRLLTVRVCLVSDPDDIEEVLVSNYQNFTKSQDYRALARVLGNGLLTSEGDFWKRQRRLIQPGFHRERIASYGALMTSYTEHMLDAWRDGEVRDIHADLMRLTLEIAARSLFDVDIAGSASAVGNALNVVLEEYLGPSNFASHLPAWVPLIGRRRFRRALRELDSIVYGFIGERRASGKQSGDLLGMLLEARDENGDGMPDEQLRDEVMTLLLAGHETTANTLTWALYLLARHPEVEARLCAELRAVLNGRAPQAQELHQLPYTGMVVSEAMRLYPPVWAIGRTARDAFDLHGYHFRAGTNVFISQWVVHRNPRYFPDPDRFDPDRWREDSPARRNLPRFAYFPFGAGPRVCVGAGLALTEATLVLATLLQRFQFSLTSTAPVELMPSVTLRPKVGPRMRIARR
jgi:cytochrome P450